MTTDVGYFSHFPILAACIMRTSGPIIECGVGWGSTPLIHYLSLRRFVVSADSDVDWLMNFSMGYSREGHEFHHIAPLDSVNEMIDAWTQFAHAMAKQYQWGVAFIDNAPGESRIHIAHAFSGSARFVVCHDTEADEPLGGGNYQWRQLEGVFKYKSVMKRMRPWTTVYSNFEEFHIEKCDTD